VKPFVGVSSTTLCTYTYGGKGYANPDAVTQIANGLSTTTYTYDNNGNVIQSKTTDGNTTTYIYDHANRLTALGAAGATTTATMMKMARLAKLNIGQTLKLERVEIGQ
jgi:YD repeat-containing protein